MIYTTLMWTKNYIQQKFPFFKNLIQGENCTLDYVQFYEYENKTMQLHDFSYDKIEFGIKIKICT